ncbi:MAG: HSP20 family protein [Flavobacterium sp.]|jgi:HSP20 family protein
MRLFEDSSHGLSGANGSITEGWQHLWLRARNAITYFAPTSKNTPPQSTRWGIMPVDLTETEKSLALNLEIPGMLREDFDIKIDHQLLIVRGIKSIGSTKNSKSDDDGKFHFTERAFGQFERLIPLPCPVDESNTIANYKSGVLSIKLLKESASTTRRISVN